MIFSVLIFLLTMAELTSNVFFSLTNCKLVTWVLLVVFASMMLENVPMTSYGL